MKIVRKIVICLLDIVFVFLIFWFILGYINFSKISKGDNPLYIVKENKYSVNSGNVTVYDNIIYKIVKYEKPYVNTTYSLKLWFMDDIK